jgi:hypothetical protein
VNPELPRNRWQCVAATPWLTATSSGALRSFLRAPYRLPSWVPEHCARHALSPLLPPVDRLGELVRALHGRLFVVNHRLMAAIGQGEAARARALVAYALAAHAPGKAPAPWTTASDRGSGVWPTDSRAAQARMLAREWLARHGGDSGWGGARAAAVALYEGPAAVTTHARAEVDWGAGLPAAAQVRTVVPYRLVVVVAHTAEAVAHPLTDASAAAQATVAERLTSSAVGDAEARAWFAGRVLLPETMAVAGMDAAARHRWASVTGRGGGQDVYWFPESWARFLEPGRTVGAVTAAQVGRPAPSRRAADTTEPTFDPGVDRGLCVPPGYALVECLGTLAPDAVAL